MKGRYCAITLTLLVLPLSGCGAFTSPDDIKIADPARAVADARRIIETQRKTQTHYPVLIENDDLPESLKLPGLRYAAVYEDHIGLVLARNPDWRIGARIWSADSKRKHADTQTKYPEVFFYRYYNDDPESPENIP